MLASEIDQAEQSNNQSETCRRNAEVQHSTAPEPMGPCPFGRRQTWVVLAALGSSLVGRHSSAVMLLLRAALGGQAGAVGWRVEPRGFLEYDRLALCVFGSTGRVPDNQRVGMAGSGPEIVGSSPDGARPREEEARDGEGGRHGRKQGQKLESSGDSFRLGLIRQ